jgi:glycosyltransferase involved in cell wall biosynthesis
LHSPSSKESSPADSPLVSVIIAVFNGSETLVRCLESVTSQVGTNFELIVIDGGSTDGTVDIVRSYSDRLAYWESEVDRGVAHAWNKGVARASGEWVLFLGADDYLWSSTAISQITSALESAKSGVDVIYADVMGVSKDGQKLGLLSSKWNRNKFLGYGLYFSHQGIFHRRAGFSTFGAYEELYRFALDYELLLRWLKRSDPLYAQGVIVSAMQMGGMSNTPANAVRTLSEFREARRAHNFSAGNLLFYRALLGAYVKVTLHRINSYFA